MHLVQSNEQEQQKLSPAEHVFNYWREVMNKPRAKLNAKRKKVIQDRIKEGYEWEDFKAAIDGCKNSSFHMGDNGRGRAYNDIELICRDGVKLETFSEIKSDRQNMVERLTDLSWADGL
jgi:uncharacterized phage protein (TIGR02220 family)